MIAIQPPADPNWKFIENNQEYKAIFDQIIPAEVVEKLRL